MAAFDSLLPVRCVYHYRDASSRACATAHGRCSTSESPAVRGTRKGKHYWQVRQVFASILDDISDEEQGGSGGTASSEKVSTGSWTDVPPKREAEVVARGLNFTVGQAGVLTDELAASAVSNQIGYGCAN